MHQLQIRLQHVRARSEALVAPLPLEDLVVQTCAEVSPLKWHLGHMSWLFEHFILKSWLADYHVFDESFHDAFNSYYISQGIPGLKTQRGSHSRPTVGQVIDYRNHVNEALTRLFHQDLPEKVLNLLELGIQHEQQHQELMVYDMLHVLASNHVEDGYPGPSPVPTPRAGVLDKETVVRDGLHTIGHDGGGFAFDNEGPAHRVFLQEVSLSPRLVTNGEYMRFVETGQYEHARCWLSAGWERCKAEGWKHPLYWRKVGSGWEEYSFKGWQPLDLAAPVSNVSFFEADAYARWANHRLPTEFEWEVAAAVAKPEHAYFGSLWQHTASAYLPYPGYSFINDGLGEYNGKFMSGQMVQRGSSYATPEGHSRITYRNFFEPGSRWQASGIRVALG